MNGNGAESSVEQRLERAKGYPYPRPESSFVFAHGNAFTVKNHLWKGPAFLEDMLQTAAPVERFNLDNFRDVEWKPVLAIGSNASHVQLARKYANNNAIIPAVQSVLADFDVVYAPLVSSYGSCTATLQHSPGTVVEVFVTYLTPALFERMLETEGAYDLVQMNNIDLKVGISLEQYQKGETPVDTIDSILQFNHQKGTLAIPMESSSNGSSSNISLKAVEAINRKFPAVDQIDMLTKIMQMEVPHEQDLDSWIMRNLEDKEARRNLVTLLTSMHQPFKYEHTELIARLGHAYSKNVK